MTRIHIGLIGNTLHHHSSLVQDIRQKRVEDSEWTWSESITSDTNNNTIWFDVNNESIDARLIVFLGDFFNEHFASPLIPILDGMMFCSDDFYQSVENRSFFVNFYNSKVGIPRSMLLDRNPMENALISSMENLAYMGRNSILKMIKYVHQTRLRQKNKHTQYNFKMGGQASKKLNQHWIISGYVERGELKSGTQCQLLGSPSTLVTVKKMHVNGSVGNTARRGDLIDLEVRGIDDTLMPEHPVLSSPYSMVSEDLVEISILKGYELYSVNRMDHYFFESDGIDMPCKVTYMDIVNDTLIVKLSSPVSIKQGACCQIRSADTIVLRGAVKSLLSEGKQWAELFGLKRCAGGKLELPSLRNDDDIPLSAHVHAFYMARHPVSQRQWVSVMHTNPSKVKGDNIPVHNVSWKEIQTFIKILRNRTGLWFRLPAEIEWTFARKKHKALVFNSPVQPISRDFWEWCEDMFCEKRDFIPSRYSLNTAGNLVFEKSEHHNRNRVRCHHSPVKGDPDFRAPGSPDTTYENTGFSLALDSLEMVGDSENTIQGWSKIYSEYNNNFKL